MLQNSKTGARNVIFPFLSEDLTRVRAGKLSKVYVTLPQITPNQLFSPLPPYPCNSSLLLIHFTSLFVLLCSTFPHPVFCHVMSNDRCLCFDESQRGARQGQAEWAVRDATGICHRDVSTTITGVAHAISATNTLSTLARARRQEQGIIPDMQLQEVNSGSIKRSSGIPNTSTGFGQGKTAKILNNDEGIFVKKNTLVIHRARKPNTKRRKATNKQKRENSQPARVTRTPRRWYHVCAPRRPTPTSPSLPLLIATNHPSSFFFLNPHLIHSGA